LLYLGTRRARIIRAAIVVVTIIVIAGFGISAYFAQQQGRIDHPTSQLLEKANALERSHTQLGQIESTSNKQAQELHEMTGPLQDLKDRTSFQRETLFSGSKQLFML